MRAIVVQLVAPPLAESDETPARPRKQRELAFVAAGASGTGITHRIEELLADGFGRD